MLSIEYLQPLLLGMLAWQWQGQWQPLTHSSREHQLWPKTHPRPPLQARAACSQERLPSPFAAGAVHRSSTASVVRLKASRRTISASRHHAAMSASSQQITASYVHRAPHTESSLTLRHLRSERTERTIAVTPPPGRPPEAARK